MQDAIEDRKSLNYQSFMNENMDHDNSGMVNFKNETQSTIQNVTPKSDYGTAHNFP